MAHTTSETNRQAYVTLVTNDNYGYGALVLGHSIRESGTVRKLAVLVTEQVTLLMRRRLSDVWDHVVVVSELNSNDSERLSMLRRPELGVTLTKIYAWRLTDYDKCVFLDADTLVVRNSDALFDLPELSAAPDLGWPDCFNSGVFVFVPSEATFERLLHMAATEGSFDGGDQGLLNQAWSDWATADIRRHMSFLYNMNPNAYYSYLPAFARFGHEAKILHFIGPQKPWNMHRNANGRVIRVPNVSIDHAQMWWEVYDRYFERWSENIAALSDIAGSASQMDPVRLSAQLRALTTGDIPQAEAPSREVKHSPAQSHSIPWGSPFDIANLPPRPPALQRSDDRSIPPPRSHAHAHHHGTRSHEPEPEPEHRKLESIFSPSPSEVVPSEIPLNASGQPISGFALVEHRLNQMMQKGDEEAAATEVARRAKDRVRKIESSISGLLKKVGDLKRNVAIAPNPDVVEDVIGDMENHVRALNEKLVSLTAGVQGSSASSGSRA